MFRRILAVATLVALIACLAVRAGARSHAPAAKQPGPPGPPVIFPLQEVWHAPLGGNPAARPAFDDRQAYIPEVDGTIAAYVLVNGERRWQVALPTTIAPAAGDGLVFVATGDAIVALAADDGHEVWRQRLSHPISSALTWDTGWLIAGTDDGELLAWRARDGRLLWHVSLGARLSAPASLGGTRLYVPLADGRLLSLDLASGHLFWTRKLGGAPAEVLPLDRWLFVGSDDNFFYCLDTETGENRWRWRTGADIVGAPVVDAARVYFVSLDNVLRALDRNSGRLQWQHALTIRPFAGPVLAGRSVIVAGIDETIPAYRVADGEPEGGVLMPGELAAPPYVTPWGFTLGPSLIVVTRARSGAPQLQALARSLEPPLVPLTALPGTALTGH